MNRAWGVVRPTVKLIATVATILSSAGLAAQQAGLWRDPPEWALITMVTVIAVVAVITSIRSSYWELKGPRDARLESEVAEILRVAAREIAATRSLDRDEVGVSAFEVRRPFPWTRQQLVRVHRERGYTNPPASGLDWTKGKGVIGLCWKENKCIVKDLRSIAAAHPDCTADCYSRLSAGVTMGLSLPEFRTIVGKYSVVLAWPIHHEGNFVGCIAVDLPMGTGTKTSLDHKTVKEIVGVAAASTGKILRPRS